MSSTRRPVVDVARAASVSRRDGLERRVGRAQRPAGDPRARGGRDPQLGFRPNTIARAPHPARTQTVGMVIPDVTNPFFSDLIWEVERA